MDGKIIMSIESYEKTGTELFNLSKENSSLKEQLKSLKEDYKLLTDEITGLYNLMNGISITNKYENNSEIEEL